MNVIVIVTDTMRADHLGCYGNRWVRTPNIDRLASEGAVFDRAYTEGLPTLPTRTALLTGRYTLPFRGWQRLEPTDVPIAEVLWSRGYTSALIADTYHMHKPGMAYERGFDYVRWIRGQESDPYVVEPDEGAEAGVARVPVADERLRPVLGQYRRNTAHWRGEEDHFVAQVMRAGMEWLEGQVSGGRRDRLFLWLDSFDPHQPWDPPDSYYEMYAVPGDRGPRISTRAPLSEVNRVRALYAGEVTLVDRWVGAFLDRVRELGLLEDTLVVYTSDHGFFFGEHGTVSKNWSYEEVSHIPLIIRHPEGLGRGRRVDAFVQTCDVAPTILDFLDVRGPMRLRVEAWPKDMHGKSLLPLVSGEKDAVRDFAISGHHNMDWSIRNREWSLYLWLRPRRDKGAPELYRLGEKIATPEPRRYDAERDRGQERDNVIDEEPEVAKALERQLREFIASIPP